MRKKLITLAFIASLLSFSQCKNEMFKPIFNENELITQIFEVDTRQDVELHTTGGAIINIPKGAIEGSSDIVKIAFKEAYTITDMLKAGLVTKAGKEPLSSGGMFFIDGADGQKIKIKQAIKISVPTTGHRKGMQLYKGSKQSDGSIDWIEPQALPEQAMSDTMMQYKSLYQQNCASCHDVVKDATGPGLAFLDQRRDWDWLEKFIHNSAALIAEGDPEANCVYKRYNKTQMTAFPTLNTSEIKGIFKYINYAAASQGYTAASIPAAEKSQDSCLFYAKKMNSLSIKRRNLVSEQGTLTEVTEKLPPLSSTSISNTPARTDSTTQFDTAGAQSDAPNLISATTTASEYYKVNITTTGWYNIDILFKDRPGFENSTLIVRLKGEYKSSVTMYLAIPSENVLLNGGLSNGKANEYAFFEDNGKIRLPQGVKAHIFAFTEQGGQLFFGASAFVTSLNQAPEIALSVVTKEQIKISIEKMNLPDFDIAIGASKNAKTIGAIDKQIKDLEKYKPKIADCDCFLSDDSSIGTDIDTAR